MRAHLARGRPVGKPLEEAGYFFCVCRDGVVGVSICMEIHRGDRASLSLLRALEYVEQVSTRSTSHDEVLTRRKDARYDEELPAACGGRLRDTGSHI